MTMKPDPRYMLLDDVELYGKDTAQIQLDREAEDVLPPFEEDAPISMLGL